MKKWQKYFVIFICFILFTASTYGINLYRQYKATLQAISIAENSDGDKDDSNDGNIELESLGKEPFAMLLYGISARKQLNDGGRSDTMMLALIDAQQKKVSLISIPRDSYVQIPGYRMNKINAAYPLGGSKLMMETVESWLDIELQGFVSVDFEGFIELVDLMGGIEVEVTRKMEYDDPIDGTSIRLTPGKQVLDGKNALDFVRFRQSNDGRHASDYNRMERQQQALAALAEKVTPFRVVTRLTDMMTILSDNVKTSLTPKELETLIRVFASFNPANLETTSLQGEGYYHNGAWYEKIPQGEIERVQTIIKDFFDHPSVSDPVSQ
ncbi:transcriptional attenuator, LytR family [Clostridium aceticum]|uniref:Transcriptional attenuator, LytR family n=1 Tax=Clostridium aceticum TaxID=84022 RepID=A0A0G3WBG5_9CLOT|nr:LCP family protein [Clostridium aceticum]AKL95946.1 transcriptional attenuator, LytR family [Clostridium aceticum]